MNEVEEIKSRLDIAEVIGGYIQLKPAGRNFKALSPFKQERTPSFIVSPEKNIWHDFSTGEGGDVFSFVMKMEGVSFSEALEMLARRAGVELTRSRTRGPSADTRQKLYDAVEAAVKYYHLSLSKNKTALEYLKKERNLTPATIKAFRLGYAPDNWDSLTNFLVKKGFTMEQLKSAGLSAQKTGKSGGYDIFRGRIMFPIYDSQSRPIGFSGRVLNADAESAKYINTANTPIYNKSTAIYGLAQAKEAIRNSSEAILVEGNMDVVMLHQVGTKNVVAVSGTALTSQQLKSLSHLADTIFITFDSDEAGERATKKAVELAAEVGANVKVIRLPAGKDPDELVKNQPEEFTKLKSKALSGLDYLFDYALRNFSASSAAGKKQISNFVLPAMNLLRDSIEQDHYVKRLAQSLDVSEDSVRQKLRNQSNSTNTGLVAADNEQEPEVLLPTKNKQLEEALLELTLAFADTREALADLDLSAISTENRAIIEKLVKKFDISLNELSKALPKQENHVKILALRGEEAYSAVSEHDRRLEAYTQVHQLRELHIKQARLNLTRELAEAERNGDIKKRDTLLANIQATLNEE